MTFADPSKQWKGFKPTAYWLDTKKVKSLALNGVGQPTTIGEVLKQLEGHEVKSAEYGPLEAKVETDQGTFTFKGASFNRELLVHVLNLGKEGISPSFAQWFWFDKSHNLREAMDSYSFFVLSPLDNKIIREHVRFFDDPGSGFDPSIFTAYEADLWNWADDSDWEEARVGYWYRKFYQETQTGQLMVLRPDKPTLHYYARGTEPNPSQGKEEDIRSLLSKIYILLWVLVVVTVLLFLLRR